MMQLAIAAALTFPRFTDANAVKRDKIQNRKPARVGLASEGRDGEGEEGMGAMVPNSI